MKNPNFGLYAIAVAIAVVGGLWLGVPGSTLLVLGLALACPLMMLFMMHGMHGGGRQGQGHDAADRSGPDEHTTGR